MKDQKTEELINYRALSRFITGGELNITRNNIPKKYKYKVRLLHLFIEMWQKLIVEEKPKL